MKLSAVQIACLLCWVTLQLLQGLGEGTDRAQALPIKRSTDSCLQTFGSLCSNPDLKAATKGSTDTANVPGE